MADELIDILNNEGKATGQTALKSEAHRLGLYHASTHVWLYTSDGYILIQKRAANKDTYPGLWDISVAGHISAGETPITSALREVKEEIGLTISKKELFFLKTQLIEKQPALNMYDNELNHIYLCRQDISINKLKIQVEEVAAIKLISIQSFLQHIKDPILSKQFVPHGKSYYQFITNEIIKQLNQNL